MKRRLIVCAVAAAWTATACGGGSRALPPHAARAQARVPVTFAMHWPAHATPSRRRRPAFVSPSAVSVVVEVNPDAAAPGPVTFANAPAGGGTSSIAIDAPAGPDVFVVSLYDATQTPGETAAAGNELGHVRVTQTIVANAANTVSATVVGTVAGVRIGPLPNQAAVVPIAGSAPPAYELVGRAAASFAVTPLDVDGNAIVQPDAPPALSVTPNVRATGILSVTPVAGTTDQFTAQAIAPNTTTYPTSLVATATDANGSLATSSTIVDVTSAVYVAYANAGAPAVARFDARGAPLPLAAGAFGGLQNPVALAYDPDDRIVFVADAGAGAVLAFDENGGAVAGFARVAVAGANGVVYDANARNVYASGTTGVTVFAPNGGAPNGGAPASIAAAGAQGIAVVAATPSFALNLVDVGTPAPGLSFFTETGSAAGSATLAAQPTALAYGAPPAAGQVPQTVAQLYATSASGVAALDAFGAPVASVADAGGPFGVAVDPNTREPLVAERSANALTAYLDDLSATDAARSFTTPASLGLTQPQGVCHVF